jgi:hypothetical protein
MANNDWQAITGFDKYNLHDILNITAGHNAEIMSGRREKNGKRLMAYFR